MPSDCALPQMLSRAGGSVFLFFFGGGPGFSAQGSFFFSGCCGHGGTSFRECSPRLVWRSGLSLDRSDPCRAQVAARIQSCGCRSLTFYLAAQDKGEGNRTGSPPWLALASVVAAPERRLGSADRAPKGALGLPLLYPPMRRKQLRPTLALLPRMPGTWQSKLWHPSWNVSKGKCRPNLAGSPSPPDFARRQT